MLKRKIDERLILWKNSKNKKPLVLTGARQVGKTTTVELFGKTNYKHVIEINFIEKEIYKIAFSQSRNVDEIISALSSFIPEIDSIEEGNTLFIFDEIQECPLAYASLKFFFLDKRYDVIATGSYLGVNGYGLSNRPESPIVPEGYVTFLTMYPLDFEEFLWANKISDYYFNILSEALENECRIETTLHEMMRSLFKDYIIVGGMPEVVQNFINNKSYNNVYEVQCDIMKTCKQDVLKHGEKNDRTKILEILESIPVQLAKENNKFSYNQISSSASARTYFSAIKYLEDAKIINRCFNLSMLQIPLSGMEKREIFKIYMLDSGLLCSMIGKEIQSAILNNENFIYKGAIYENVIASIFSSFGETLHYFKKDSGTLEVDFVKMYKNKVTPIEVKATNGNAKSLKTILSYKEKYTIEQAIKLGDFNIARANNILYLPNYLAFLLKNN